MQAVIQALGHVAFINGAGANVWSMIPSGAPLGPVVTV